MSSTRETIRKILPTDGLCYCGCGRKGEYIVELFEFAKTLYAAKLIASPWCMRRLWRLQTWKRHELRKHKPDPQLSLF